jgi:Uri superfamily endonuclease
MMPTIDAQFGTYALILHARRAASVPIGRLGILDLRPGWLIYVGSAFGPGGLRARLAHHVRTPTNPHWHIDFLKPHSRRVAVWYTHDRARREHDWAHTLSALRGMMLPMPRFGASDCSCPAHLFARRDRPRIEAFRRRIHALHRDHASIRVVSSIV